MGFIEQHQDQYYYYNELSIILSQIYMNYGFIRIKQRKYDDAIIILQDSLQLHRECYYNNDEYYDYNDDNNENNNSYDTTTTTSTTTDGSNILCNYYLNSNYKNITWYNAKITIDILAYAMALANHNHQQEHHHQQQVEKYNNNMNNERNIDYYNIDNEESLENLVTMYIDMLRW